MSPSSKGAKKPSIALSKVPSVKELCERLGFQRASLKETNVFTDATHAWRKSYKTASGLPGAELLLWNQVSVQQDLMRMAERFLEDGGNGERFWSPTRRWNDDSEVQYPEDRAKIIELLMQLFWKQNRYAANNSTYGHKGVDSRDGSHERAAPIRQPPEKASSIKMPPKLASENQHQPSISRPAAGPGSSSSQLPPSRTEDTTPENITSDPHVPLPQHLEPRPSIEDDIYEVPDDDEDEIRAGAKSPIASSVRSPERVRMKRMAESRDTQPRKKRFLPESPKRRTERKRVARKGTDIVTRSTFPIAPGSTIDAALGGTRALRARVDPDIQVVSPQPPDVLQTAPEVQSPSNVVSPRRSPSLQRFSAPVAPMIPASQAEETPRSPETPRRITPPELPYKTQAASNIDKQEPPKTTSIVEHASPRPRSSPQKHLQPPTPSRTSPIYSATIMDSSRISPSTSQANRSSLADHLTGTVPSTPTSKTVEVEREQPLRSSLIDATTKRQPTVALDPVSFTPPLSALHTSTLNISDLENQGKPLDPFRASKIHQAGRSTSVEIASSKPRTKTQVPLWIITREPRYTEERWDDGKFQGTPLATFVEELSKVTQRSHIEKMKLTLRTPTSDTKITVFKDAEDSWISAKETFVEKLKEARAEARLKRPNETPSFKILVEPFYEEGASLVGNIDEDDEEFDF